MNIPVQNKLGIKTKINYDLESLRGYASLFVVLFHTIILGTFSPYITQNLSYGPPGHLCVLVFFVLSGYVIGITSYPGIKKSTILAYLRKRFLRLYPIYFVTILVTLAITWKHYSLEVIFGNLFLVQNMLTAQIDGNNSLWSINYEFLYYLLFIPISIFKLNVKWVFVSSILLGISNYFLFPFTHVAIISSYSFGFAFWITGIGIANYFRNNELKINYCALLSGLFLLLSLSYLNTTKRVLERVTIVIFNSPIVFPETVQLHKKIITFNDLNYLPYCILLILVFINARFKYRKIIYSIIQLLPLGGILYALQGKRDFNELWGIAIAGALWVISSILFFSDSKQLNQLSRPFIKAGTWLGGISYGMYVIHWPLLILFSKVPAFTGSLFSCLLGLFSFLVSLFFTSVLLEKYFQPWIRNIFNSNFR